MSWTLTAADLPDLARGATLLGTGGGGDPYIGQMLVARVLGDRGITILDPDDLAAPIGQKLGNDLGVIEGPLFVGVCVGHGVIFLLRMIARGLHGAKARSK